MYTYKGDKINIQDIIGVFMKDPDSKEIIVNQGENGKAVDMT